MSSQTEEVAELYIALYNYEERIGNLPNDISDEKFDEIRDQVRTLNAIYNSIASHPTDELVAGILSECRRALERIETMIYERWTVLRNGDVSDTNSIRTQKRRQTRGGYRKTE